MVCGRWQMLPRIVLWPGIVLATGMVLAPSHWHGFGVVFVVHGLHEQAVRLNNRPSLHRLRRLT